MSDYFSCRRILFIFVILTLLLESSLFTNLSASIVVMIKTNSSNSNISNHIKGPQYDWTVSQKNHLLGSANLGLAISEVISGRISELYGPKIVMFAFIFTTSILTMLHPVAFNCGIMAAYCIRFLIGIIMGPVVPSVTLLMVNWYSPSERIQSIAVIAAFSFGIGITLQLFLLLIYYLNWPSIFYVNGSFGLIWSIIWLYSIYDTPETHPRISRKERDLIAKKMAREATGIRKIRKEIPYRHIVTCLPFWAVVLSRFCVGCSFGFMKYQIPTYYNDILHFEINRNGFYAALPFFGNGLCGFLACYLADKLLKTYRFSKTTVRKIMESFHLLTVSISMLLLSWFGLNPTVAVILFIVCTLAISAKFAGHFGNLIDLSPNFSGTLVGIAMTFYSFGSWFSTFLCGVLLKERDNFNDWQNVFYFISGFSFICAVTYVVFATAKLQYWNDLKDERTDVQEMDSLQCNKN